MAHDREGLACDIEREPGAAHGREDEHGDEGPHHDLILVLSGRADEQPQAGHPERQRHHHQQNGQWLAHVVHAEGQLAEGNV